jgi:uncharacterized membrane protein YeaQ/YmgE (transglycosylase-associated protein family)
MDIVTLLIWVAVGAFAGWVASMIMKTDAQQGALMNIVVGIVGVFLGRWLLSFVGVAYSASWLWNAVVGILGAVVLLWVVSLIRK